MTAAAATAYTAHRGRGVHTFYGKSHILHGVSIDRWPRRGCRTPWPQWRRQKHDAQNHHGPGPADRRLGAARWQAITGLPPHKLAQLGIGYVPEDRRIFRLLTVMENLRTGSIVAASPRPGAQALLDKVFTFFRCWPSAATKPAEHYRAASTDAGHRRAMMLEPKIILLDEPTEGLMPRMVSQIGQIIDFLHKKASQYFWSSKTCR